MKRRDAILGTVAVTVLGALTKGILDMMKVDGLIVDDDEKEIAKEAMALFIGAVGNPSAEDTAERGRLAIRAWRLLNKN